jgi:hypothetical protein
MPELGEHVPTLPMNGVRDSLPSRNLLVRIQSGGTEPSPSCDRVSAGAKILIVPVEKSPTPNRG